MPYEFENLTPHHLAFGLGRKASREELDELTSIPKGETFDPETVYKDYH